MNADPGYRPELLLAETAWLRGLVRTLVRGEDAVDDVCQETLLATLRRPAVFSQNLRGWLARVARNVVARSRVRARRRASREARAARSEAVPSAAEVVAEFGMQQSVARAVEAMDEPYRATLLLRFWEGLPPREIAARMAVPVDTVRTRIKRALGLLEARLDAEHGSRGAWLVPLTEWFGKAPAAGVAPFVLGALIMSTKTKLVAAAGAAVLSLLGLWAVVGSSDTRPHDADAVAQVGADGAKGPEPASRASSGSAREPLPFVAAAAPASGSGTARLLVRVRWPDHSPAGGIGLRVTQPAGPMLGVLASTTEDGTAQFEALAPGKAWVGLDRPRPESDELELAADESRELTITVPEGIDVRGRVVDAKGTPVAGAQILLTQQGHQPQVTFAGPVSAPDGTFLLRAMHAYNVVAARAEGHGTSPFELLLSQHAKPGDTVDLELVLPDESCALAGVVLAPDGRPLPGAFVRVGTVEMRIQRTAAGVAQRTVPIHVSTDADGRFLVTELGSGQLAVHAWARGAAPLGATVELERGLRADVVLRLEPPAVLVGTVCDEAGAPLSGASVEVGGDYSYPERRSAETGSDGRYRLDELPGGVVPILVGAGEKGSQRAEVQLAAGAETTQSFRLLRGLVVSGRLVDHLGKPLAGWWVGLEDPAVRSDTQSNQPTGTQGTFTIPDVQDRAYRLRVYDESFLAPTVHLVEDVRPGDHRVVVPERARLRGEIRGKVLLPDGRPAAGAEVTLMQGEWPLDGTAKCAPGDGSFTTRKLPPGSYALSANLQGFGWVTLPDVDLLPGETKLLGELRLEKR